MTTAKNSFQWEHLKDRRHISAWLCKILEKIRLSVWSMSRLSGSLPLVNILTPMRARAAKFGWNAMVRSLLFYTPQNVSANLCHKYFISVVCNFLIITISPFFFRINSFNNASQLPLSFCKLMILSQVLPCWFHAGQTLFLAAYINFNNFIFGSLFIL